jgi:FkbM family methyltransferase
VVAQNVKFEVRLQYGVPNEEIAMRKMNLIKMIEMMGAGGFYLYCCRRWGIDPIPIKVPIFGKIRTFHEIRNIFDNFGVRGQIKDEKIEAYLSGKQKPCVIDCGVNVGITVRWWFHLNREAQVFGVDMMKEAHLFTAQAIKSIGIAQESYKPIEAALWSENGKQFKIGIGDPLHGDNGFFRKNYKANNERVFTTQTLDSIFATQSLEEVDLLKIDLEGAGAEALQGATQLIKKTKHVVIEMHPEEDSKKVSKLLEGSQFLLRKAEGNQLWWEKSEQLIRS